MTSLPASRRRQEIRVVVLAGVTLISFGSWIYSFGVLLDDLVGDLRTKESFLVAAFGAAQLLAGVGSVIAGRVLDRQGSTPVFLSGAVGATILACAGLAGGPGEFAVTFGLGAGIVGATGFYHISQTAAARLAPGHETAAITRLTLYAAFSGPIFYPLTAWLVGRWGWRWTLSVEALATLAMFLLATFSARTPPAERERKQGWGLGRTDRATLRYAAAVILSVGAIQILSVYQVPVMLAAGVSLGLASALAGARGYAQFLGRLPIVRVVGRVGAARTLRGALLLLALGSALLGGSASVAVASASMLIAGVAIGAQSPMVGIRGREVFEPHVLGSALGTVTLGTFVAGALWPMAAGLLVDGTGTRQAAVVLATVTALASALVAGGDRRQTGVDSPGLS